MEIIISIKLSKELSDQLFYDPHIFCEISARMWGVADALNVDEFEIVDSENKVSISSISSK